MFSVPTFDTFELRLSLAILCTNMTAGRTRPAGVTGVDGKHVTAQPRLLVFQLAAELAPALIENRLIKAGFCLYASSWCLQCAAC